MGFLSTDRQTPLVLIGFLRWWIFYRSRKLGIHPDYSRSSFFDAIDTFIRSVASSIIRNKPEELDDLDYMQNDPNQAKKELKEEIKQLATNLLWFIHNYGERSDSNRVFIHQILRMMINQELLLIVPFLTLNFSVSHSRTLLLLLSWILC